MKRLLLVLIAVVFVASLTGCFGGRWNPKWLYGEPWEPSTVVPPIPPVCEMLPNGMYAGTKAERQRLPHSCSWYELRHKLALNNLKHEIIQHNIQKKLDGIPNVGGWDTHHIVITHTGPDGGYLY